MVRLGLTGGVGSGKTTVATMLLQAGAGVVDADAISRQLTAPGGPAIETLRQVFGNEFITSDNGLDRSKIRSLVFSDPQARQQLEGIIHPLVQHETQKQTQSLQNAGCPCIVFDIPLLVESNSWRPKVDKVLVLDCTPEVQIQRTVLRSQLSVVDAQQIVNAQASRNTRLKAADWVICNSSLTLKELALEVKQIHPYCGL
jgi:dephospho-CoA kinase